MRAKPYYQGYWGDSRIQGYKIIRHKWLEEVSDESFWLHGEAILVGF